MKTFNGRTIAVGAIVLAALVIGASAYICTRDQAPPEPEPLQSQQSYITKDGKVYYRTIMQVNEGPDQVDDYEVRDADANTFTALDEYWAKDKSSLFYTGKIVRPAEGTASADIASFTVFEDSNGLAKDGRAVYRVFSVITASSEEEWFYEAIPGADPVTFTVLETFPYATDKNNAYYFAQDEVRKIEGADGSTFNMLGQCAAVEKSVAHYAADAKSVFVEDKVLQEADRETFHIVAEYNNGPDGMYVAGTYAVDKNHVYKDCGEVTQGNPKTCSFANLGECE